MIVTAALSASLPTTAETAAVPRQDAGPAWQSPAVSVLVGTADAKPVDLRVGPHRFRIPRAYFRHPPHPSGVNTGFYIRALSPDMEPESDANRAAFRASVLTAENQRVLQVVLVPAAPGMPATDVARWMLGNAARGRSRVGAGRGEIEDFTAPSKDSFGLHVLRGQPWPGTDHVDEDLYHGTLADGRFVAVRCGRFSNPERPSFCQLWFDWRPDAQLEASFLRVRMPEWREISEATLALVDSFAIGDEGSAAGTRR